MALPFIWQVIAASTALRGTPANVPAPESRYVGFATGS